MNDAEKLLFQRLSGDLTELHTWLGILITHFGNGTDNLFTLVLPGSQVSEARNLIADNRIPSVSIDYDIASDTYTLDVL